MNGSPPPRIHGAMMTLSRLFFSRLSLPLLVGAAACGTSAATLTEEAGSGALEAGVEPDAPRPGVDASHDAAPEARPDAPPLPRSEWTAEPGSRELSTRTTASADGLIADPIVPRRLMIQLSGRTGVALPWTAGVFGALLQWNGAGQLRFGQPGSEGGFAANGDFYGFLGIVDAAQPVQVGVRTKSVWSWKEILPGFGSWPARSVHVMPGLPVRVFVKTSADLIEISGAELTPPRFPLGAVQEIALSPDRTTYLGLSSGTLRSCLIVSGACNDVTTSGLGAGETIGDVWFDPYVANRVLVSTREPAPSSTRHTYFASSYASPVAFTELRLPARAKTPRPLTVPGKPNIFVVETHPTSDVAQAIAVTRDFGAAWSALPLPPTEIIDVSGVAVDAAGTLFLVRNRTLFSQPL